MRQTRSAVSHIAVLPVYLGHLNLKIDIKTALTESFEFNYLNLISSVQFYMQTNIKNLNLL